jgi:hypothetical protein
MIEIANGLSNKYSLLTRMKFYNFKPDSWRVICLYLFVLLGFSTYLSAQQKDFRGFYSVSVDHEIFNFLDLSVAPEVRLMNNQTDVETWMINADLSAPAFDWLRLGGLYRFQLDVSDPKQNNIIHRFGLFARFDYRIKPIDFYYRCSYQHEYENINSSKNGMVPKVFWRNKIRQEKDRF